MNASKTQEAIEVSNTPAIPGLVFRHFGGDQDFPHIVELINACNRVDQIDEVATLEVIRNNYTHLTNCDLDKDMLIVEIGGKLVGYTRVWWAEEPGLGLVYFHFGYLHPDWRRRGLGTAMLDWNQNRLSEVAAEHDPDVSKIFRSFFDENEMGTKALLESADYHAVRFFYEMKRDLSQPIPETELPQGLEIRPAQKAQFRQIWEAKDEAFRDHWGYTSGSEQDYERWLGFPNFQPELWKVAWEGDQVAGMILNFIAHEENQELGRKWGWTDPICVRRPWRRRGLATALLMESMRELKAHGMEYAALGVDVDNPLGALNLYTNAGYEAFAHFESWEKPLA